MSRLNCRFSLLLLAVATSAANVSAVDKPAATLADGKSGADRQAILALLNQVEADFNAGDAKALATCWTENGEFVGAAGARTEGRENIEKQFQEAFAARKDGMKLKFHLNHFHLANEALAMVEAVAEVKPAPLAGGTPLSEMVLVKQNERWLIESAHETIAHLPPDASHLKQLEWLAGDWSSESSKSGITVRASCDWTTNREFLIRKFKIEGAQALLHGGTEVIGWDPRANHIRSWVFDSDGGFGENVWVRDGNRWLVKYSGTLADGGEVTATHILVNVDAATITVQSKDRVINGIAQPDVPEITLKRQAVAPKPAKAEPK
jgi:uncharacterized protein (TIGR02246 family)